MRTRNGPNVARAYLDVAEDKSRPDGERIQALIEAVRVMVTRHEVDFTMLQAQLDRGHEI